MKIIIILLSFLFISENAFCDDKIVKNRDNSLSISIPLSGFNIKYSKLLDEERDFFSRVSLEPFLYREEVESIISPTNITSHNSFGLEAGLNNYLSKNYNVEKDIKYSSYLKTYIGTITNIESKIFNITPYLGTGIGFNYTYGFFGATLALDVLTTIQTSNVVYIGGILFVRPELNLKFEF